MPKVKSNHSESKLPPSDVESVGSKADGRGADSLDSLRTAFFLLHNISWLTLGHCSWFIERQNYVHWGGQMRTRP
jgi:hypothetical protein